MLGLDPATPTRRRLYGRLGAIFFLGGGRRIADREQRADQEHPQLASHVPPFFEEMMAAQREVGRVGRGSGE